MTHLNAVSLTLNISDCVGRATISTLVVSSSFINIGSRLKKLTAAVKSPHFNPLLHLRRQYGRYDIKGPHHMVTCKGGPMYRKQTRVAMHACSYLLYNQRPMTSKVQMLL